MVRDWMVTGMIAVVAAAAAWGGAQARMSAVSDRVDRIENWKDVAVEKMGNMDGKLDALLAAQGIDYKPRGGR
jgi:hypothetical protein